MHSTPLLIRESNVVIHDFRDADSERSSLSLDFWIGSDTGIRTRILALRGPRPNP